jgi:signal transduction histidine kinase/CheY-like chemotaxis protein
LNRTLGLILAAATLGIATLGWRLATDSARRLLLRDAALRGRPEQRLDVAPTPGPGGKGVVAQVDWDTSRQEALIGDHATRIALILGGAMSLFSVGVLRAVRRRVLAPLADLRCMASASDAPPSEPAAGGEGSREIAALRAALCDGLRRSEDLRRGQDEVERRVEERTRELQREVEERKAAEREAQAARTAAEAASRAKSEFLATISHEVRTPMNAVLGFSTVLMGTRLDPDQQEFVRSIRNSGESLMALLSDVLDFSKLEAGQLVLETAEFDLVQLAEEVTTVLAPRAEEQQLELAVHCHPGVPTRFQGDPMRIRQVLLHLLGNAVKFTERGHVLLEVLPEAPASQATMPRVLFRIHDTGIGVAPEDQHLLFRKFQQIDSSATRRFGGTGIGLAISRMLVEFMGGEIGAESAPGRGSTFWFHLPCPPTTGPDPGPRWVIEPELRSARVLVVNDQEVARMVFHRQLAAWGLQHECAATAADALAKLRTSAAFGEPFDILFLDDSLSDRDPVSFAREVRRDPVLRTCSLVQVSGPAKRTETTQLLARGFATTLNRPVVRQEGLWEALRKAFDHRKCLLAESSAPVATARPDAPQDAPAVAFGLPARREPAPPPPSRPPHKAAAPSVQRKVLLVEDNEVNGKLAARLLENLGCLVTLAQTGRDAVGRAQIEAFDLVFMDCTMPDMDGFEATREIRRLEARGALPHLHGARLPIVAVTANAGQGDRARCLESGMDDYVTKPISAEDLRKALDRWAPSGAHAKSY